MRLCISLFLNTDLFPFGLGANDSQLMLINDLDHNVGDIRIEIPIIIYQNAVSLIYVSSHIVFKPDTYATCYY